MANNSNNNHSTDFLKKFNLPPFFISSDALANAYYNYEKIEEIARWLQSKTDVKPLVGIVCGSGLASLAERVVNKTVIPYEEIPDFPKSTVPGHHGNLVFGQINDLPVVCMQGRFHPYEGYAAAVCTVPIKVFKMLGVKLVLLTNAAGGINRTYKVGDLMILKDHITYPGFALHHPLVGPNDERFGPRFMPINKIYTKELRDLLKQVGKDSGIELKEGVYAAIGGPTYETVTEVRFIEQCGADAVGMSTAHEAIVASYCGMKVLAMSIITDMAVNEFDVNEESNHDEICAIAHKRTADVVKLVVDLIQRIQQNLSVLQ